MIIGFVLSLSTFRIRRVDDRIRRQRQAGSVSGSYARSSLTDHVVLVTIVLVTEVLDDFLVRYPALRPGRRPRPGVRTRVVDRDLVAQCVEIGARNPLDQMQRLG